MRISTSKRANRMALPATLAAALFAIIGFVSPLHAADVNTGWGSWWLPPDHSKHGPAIDALFVWIFWITMITWIAVQLVMFVFLIKYRSRPDRKKARFTHGNKRLEMIWTIAPAIVLALLAIFSKSVWDNYRYSPDADNPDRAKILVIGQQFKWNSVYPGPDGKFGRYLIFPKPTDVAWPNPSGDTSKPYIYGGVPGPAYLPFDQAVREIGKYNDAINPLGKDFSDPDGKDDNFQDALAREIIVPKDRPIEIVLSSKDVLHDFFLPNFRVKLDAVPGMRGHIYFTALQSSAEREKESRKSYTPDQLLDVLKRPENKEFMVSITEADQAKGAEFDKNSKQWLFRDANKKTIIRDGKFLSAEVVEKLKAAGVKEISAYPPGVWELVCEELCGQGHGTMRGTIRVVDNDEYKKKFETGPGSKVAMNEKN